jgi:hypothetical protein
MRAIGRRDFLEGAAMTIAAAQLGSARAVAAPPAQLKQIRAGQLDVGYAEFGPPTGSPVLLLHGWPYDIHAFDEVAPILADRGFRVIVPFL